MKPCDSMRWLCLRGAVVVPVVLVLWAVTPAARASRIVYSNIASFENDAVGSALQLWDDVMIVGGGRLESLTIRAFNQGSSPSGLSAVLDINLFDTLNNRPSGTTVGSISIDRAGASFAPGLTPAITLTDLVPLGIELPPDATLAVGLRFPGQSQWAMPFFDPPLVGASQDGYWLGFNPVPVSPVGGVGSFGIELVTVPEPGTAGTVLVLAGLGIWSRRRCSNEARVRQSADEREP